MVRDRAAHRAAMTIGAAYLTTAGERERDGGGWVPELSRRARGFTVYAALAALGRRGIADLVARSCALAGRMAARLRERGAPHVTIANDVVLNQVVVRFEAPAGGDPDRLAREVVRRVQADGTCWAGGTTWQGRAAMRLSVSGWSTTEDDVDRSADAILRCVTATLHERQREKERA
jgi:glutamate/tyrosine decarboxylase-like PLP-dependent enzyme